jgi:selenocysteine lyase/cysteine desulfurase
LGALQRIDGAVAPNLGQSDDPLGVRVDFPVTREWAYLDSPYITPSPKQVVEVAQRFLEAKAVDPVSLGRMLEETTAVRRKYARLIGASEAEVGVLFATSEGENIVARALGLGSGDNVVIDDLHYDTTYVLYQHLAETAGLEVRTVPSRHGAAPPEAFAEYVDSHTRLISVSWVSHQNGYCHDLRALAELAHAHGSYLYADAIQGVGMVELDVRETGIDFFTAGTYKWLLGGFGVAPFFVREELLDRISVDRLGALHLAEGQPGDRYTLYPDARKYIYATLGFGAIYQLSAGLDYLLEVGVGRIEAHTVPLAHRLRQGLLDQGFPVWTPAENRSAIVAFEPGVGVERLQRDLDRARIRVSLKDGGRTVRAGVALFNNQEEVDRLLQVTAEWA